MSTEVTWQIDSTSSEATEALAEKLGRALKGREIIELASDLGGGKTTFVRGLARGAGSSDKVASPTFTINKVYDCPNFQMYHFDFYRLSEPGIIADELAEVAGQPQTVTVIEWAEIVKQVLPLTRLSIRIEQTPTGMRQFHFTAPAELDYLIAALQSDK